MHSGGLGQTVANRPIAEVQAKCACSIHMDIRIFEFPYVLMQP